MDGGASTHESAKPDPGAVKMEPQGLSASELGEALHQAGVAWSPERVDHLLKALDESGAGKVAASEFERCVDVLFKAAEAFATLSGGGSDWFTKRKAPVKVRADPLDVTALLEDAQTKGEVPMALKSERSTACTAAIVALEDAHDRRKGLAGDAKAAKERSIDPDDKAKHEEREADLCKRRDEAEAQPYNEEVMAALVRPSPNAIAPPPPLRLRWSRAAWAVHGRCPRWRTRRPGTTGRLRN